MFRFREEVFFGPQLNGLRGLRSAASFERARAFQFSSLSHIEPSIQLPGIELSSSSCSVLKSFKDVQLME